MASRQTYQHLLEVSQRVNWRLDDLVGGGRRLDLTRPLLPETFARTEALGFLSPAEKLKLNHIRARGYLALFELVEEFVVPFISAQADEEEPDEPFRAEALRHFAGEEEKHRDLFAMVLRDFDASFGTVCCLIGPTEDICQAILGHRPLAVTIAILGLEWMSQGHYLGTIKDNQDLDPQFKRLLKHHWIEEAQHARLDGLVLKSLARSNTPRDIEAAIREYFEIGAFLDTGFKLQAELDLLSLERAMGRVLSKADHRQFLEVQHRALQWTFLGSAMQNRNFLAALAGVSGEAASRVAIAGKSFELN